MAKKILMGQLENGMKVWNQGHLFLVTKVNHIIVDNEYGKRPSTYYTGICVNKDDDIVNTGYNGGSYGGIDTLEVCIEL